MNAPLGGRLLSLNGRYYAAEEFNGSPTLDGTDIVYAGSNDMYLHAVNRTNGKCKITAVARQTRL